ncbi:MDR family MFS transporter [Brevibacillus sp. SYSU BS000544]|uniref:MDR family MFS transporter n=1 Tax=Brevibacillus sp. SYSU BS000544 TaxID=3416443 RepID=UPI003CE56A5F
MTEQSVNREQDKKMGFVVAGLLLGILIASMDNTIVATAMGTIVSELGGLDKFVWVTSAYMVAAMAGMPIFGKLSDMYGRKWFFLMGLVVFLLGSILCGMAQNIVQLSIFRAIQGIGGGALMPIAFTIVFDIFPPDRRGKMSGLFGAVFGLSSIFGPLLGAYITEYIDWRWVFYINLPLGIICFSLIWLFYKESPVHTKQKIDWWGAITMVGAVVSLMFALELGGHTYAWDSGVILSLFLSFAVLFTAFIMIERRAEEPIISFAMFQQRLFGTSTFVSLFYGASFVVGTVYIPIFIQGVLGGSATNSGLILLPMMLGSVVASQTGGMIASKTSYRNTMLISGVFLITGLYLLSTISPATTKTMITIYMIITGMGVGFSFSVLSMASIHHFDIRKRGSANSTNTFLRSLGMTLGITVFGIMQRNIFTRELSATMGGASQGSPISDDPRALLSPETRAQIPAPVLEKITDALSTSIAQTFLWTLVPAVIAVGIILFMSKEGLGDLRKADSRA